jgi:hypothetical protein
MMKFSPTKTNEKKSRQMCLRYQYLGLHSTPGGNILEENAPGDLLLVAYASLERNKETSSFTFTFIYHLINIDLQTAEI